MVANNECHLTPLLYFRSFLCTKKPERYNTGVQEFGKQVKGKRYHIHNPFLLRYIELPPLRAPTEAVEGYKSLWVGEALARDP